MKTESKIQFYNEVLTLNQRVHTAFGDMFPHAGLLQIGGSRKFMQKAYLSHLKKIITEILSILGKCDASEPVAKTVKLWNEIVDLLSRLELHSDNFSDNDINGIAVTLYFASGTIWNYLVEKLQITPVPDKRYVLVEPVPVLLKMTNKCDGPFANVLDNAIDSLIVEIHSLGSRK